MKKAIRVFSVLGILLALLQLLALFSSTSPARPEISTGKPVKDLAERFPPDSARFVDFEVDEGTFGRMTPREQQDQMLDWLLITIVSNAGLSVEEINQALYDLPAVRHGYMHPVANFEYGPLRSRFVGDGRVAALIPAGVSAEERADYLAHLADAHRKDLGEIPTMLLVFEYALNQDDHTALLTRRGDIEAPILFSEEHGYYQFKIDSLADLKRFMASVDDVTYAGRQGGSLTLGGRKIKSRAYRGIRVEDVAAIWQAEHKIQAQLQALEAFEAKWGRRSYSTAAEQRRFAVERERAWNQLLTTYTRHGHEGEFVDGSGFSLDPSYDLSGIAEHLGVEDTLDHESFFAVLEAMAQDRGADAAREVLQEIRYTYGFQTARYDGDLQGTEVGMVLFYTDLLAKLWALDFLGAAPDRYIDGFVTMTKPPLSPIYEEEVNTLSHTRLWFGHRNDGFQIAGEGQHLILARNGARIYAASSSALSPGQEEEPAADSDAFLRWWNDHYEEVARFEPEYERLNEIMKWSLIIGWLNESNGGTLLEFLRPVRVDTSNWFPEWVRQNAQLRFKQWDKVGFFRRGYKGTHTETLPLLYSKPYNLFGYDEAVLSGGVSLASKQLFKGRRGLAPSANPFIRRSKIDYGMGGGGGLFKTFEGIEYRLHRQGPNRALATVKARPEARLRGRHSELANVAFERLVLFDKKGLHFVTSTGANQVGSLSISPTKNGFKVRWLSRDVDAGQSLTHRLSTSADPDRLVLHEPNVEAAVKLAGEHAYLLKLRGSKNWMKVVPEEVPRVSIAPEWQARVAGFGSPVAPKRLNLAWVQEASVTTALRREGGGVLKSSEGTKAVLGAPSAPRGPSVVQHLENGDYGKLAEDIFETPLETHKALREHFAEELKRVDDFLTNTQPDRALQHLDDLIDRFGPQPELTVRRGLVQLARGRFTDALIDFNKTLARRPDLLNQVNQRLEQQVPPHEALRLFPDETGAHWDFHYQLDHLSSAEAVRSSELGGVVEGGAPIYVMDAPGLNKYDWNPSALEATLQAVVSGNPDALRRLPRGDIAGYNPAVVYAPKRSTPQSDPPPLQKPFDPALTNKFNVVRAARQAERGFRNAASNPGCQDEDRNAGCRDEEAIYLVIGN